MMKQQLEKLNDQKARTVGKARKQEFEKEIRKLRKGFHSDHFEDSDFAYCWEVSYPLLAKQLQDGPALSDPSAPLSYMELTSYSTWFAMYPQKQFGKEYTTQNREFPMRVKGEREDIETGFQRFFEKRERLRAIRQKAINLQKRIQ